MKRSCVQVGRAACSLAALLALVRPAHAAEWTLGPSLNTPRHSHGACVDPCGNMYVVGGRHQPPQFTDLDSVEKLSFNGSEYATSWVFITPMPTPRSGHAVVCINGFVYVISGTIDGQTNTRLVYRYDTLTDRWDTTSIPDVNVARSHAGATVDKWGRIWLIGGSVPAQVTASVEIYDPARPELGWVEGPSVGEARAGAGVVTDHEWRIYVLGGSNATGHIASVERFDPCNPGKGWESLPAIPGTASQFDEAVTGADGRIYIAGGWLPGETSRVVRFDPDTNQWEPWVDLIGPARNQLRLVLGGNGRIFAIGGLSGLVSQNTVESLSGPWSCGSGLVFDADGDGDVDLIDFLAFQLCFTGSR